jgi:hypothetical protein
MKNLLIILGIFFTFSGTILAEEKNTVATVLLVKGEVRVKEANGKLSKVVTNQSLEKGVELISSAKSFAKIIFIDKSTLNLGPSSSIFIQEFQAKKAGIINLIKGQIRSQVTKDFMEMSDKEKSKLYIKTKTAAMGIRGTDFQVNYNPANQNSSLIVFEGNVAMAHIDRLKQDQVFSQDNLETLVTSNFAVQVRQGQISAVNLNISDKALVPTKLAPKQLDALKENPTGLDEQSSGKKQYRDVIPPGVNSEVFVNPSIEGQKIETKDAAGYYNEKTREFKPAAGSIVDLKTVNIISPPNDAPFDQATKTFIVTENYGKIDQGTGKFEAPKGYELTNEGQFKPTTDQQAKRPGETTKINQQDNIVRPTEEVKPIIPVVNPIPENKPMPGIIIPPPTKIEGTYPPKRERPPTIGTPPKPVDTTLPTNTGGSGSGGAGTIDTGNRETSGNPIEY